MRRIGVKAFGQTYQLVSFHQAAENSVQAFVAQEALKARSIIDNVLAYSPQTISGWSVFAAG